MSPSSGHFIWRALITPHIDSARTFYRALSGWTSTARDPATTGSSLVFGHPELDETTGGAMRPVMDAVPPHWLDYVTVDDLDARLDQVVALGGTRISDPVSIDIGRFAVVQDPTGATLGLFEGRGDRPAPADRRPPVGTFCWSQLFTDDLDAAVGFYTALFGWTASTVPGGMVVFEGADAPVASARALPADAPTTSHWLPYIAVDDTDAATERARGAGAQIVHPPETLPGMGRFSVMIDPAGATVALWKHLTPPT